MKMRIKEVAKRTGLTEKTIRYYESVGLVVPDMEMKDHRVWRDYNEKHARLLLRRAQNEARPRPHPGPAESR